MELEKQIENRNEGNIMEDVYVKPTIEVIEMEMEGILCASGEDFGDGGGGVW